MQNKINNDYNNILNTINKELHQQYYFMGFHRDNRIEYSKHKYTKDILESILNVIITQNSDTNNLD